MILDAQGNPVPPAEPHRFGQFRLPDNAHIRFGDGIKTEPGYQWTGYGGVGHKEHAERRCEKRCEPGS